MFYIKVFVIDTFLCDNITAAQKVTTLAVITSVEVWKL